MKLLWIFLISACAFAQTNTCASGTDSTAQCQPVIFHPWNHGGWAAVHHVGDLTNSEVSCYSPDMVAMGNGAVNVMATSQSATCNDAFEGSHTFSVKAGFLIWYSYSIQLGTIEVRTRFGNVQPRDAGIWAQGTDCQGVDLVNAANISPCNWPNAGSEELDIAEAHWPTEVFPDLLQDLTNSGGAHVCTVDAPTDPTLNFHTYKVVMGASSTTWFIDGTQTCTQAVGTSKGVYLKLSVQVESGTLSGTPGADVTQYVKVTDPNGNVVFFDDFVNPVAASAVKPMARLARLAGGSTSPTTGIFTLGIAKNEGLRVR